MATEKKIYVVLDVTVKRIYDTKIKAKVVAGMMKSGNAAINKNKKLATSKPSGWKKETDKGFKLKANLESLTRTEVKNEILFKAVVTAIIYHAKDGKLVKKLPSGNGTVKISIKQRKPELDAIFIAGNVLETLIKSKINAVMVNAK